MFIAGKPLRTIVKRMNRLSLDNAKPIPVEDKQILPLLIKKPSKDSGYLIRFQWKNRQSTKDLSEISHRLTAANGFEGSHSLLCSLLLTASCFRAKLRVQSNNHKVGGGKAGV